jgi:hypothetical protein
MCTAPRAQLGARGCRSTAPHAAPQLRT